MRKQGDFGRRLTTAEQAEIWGHLAAGETHASAAAAVDCSVPAVRQLLARTGGLAPRTRPRSPLRLSVSEREEISRGLQAGASCRTIAARLARAPSTISREVAGGGGAGRYRAWSAEAAAVRRARRPKVAKLACSPRLRRAVERLLAQRWSPQQIAHRLVRDYPGEEQMRVSHETIYRSLYVQARGALRHELTRSLRSGRSRRKAQRRVDGRGGLRDMVLIADRPAEAADRAVPGHWEGDLILGQGGHSAIGTLVERTTRLTLLLALPHGRTAEEVRRALARRIRTLPAELRRSLTWDRGREMAEHARFSVDSGVQVYFCDPHSPWQRGTNENTNGLLRQYFPKGSDLSVHRQAQLNAVARELNGRPRRTLDWTTPAEAFARVVR